MKLIRLYKNLLFLIILLLVFSCATSKADYGKLAKDFDKTSIDKDSTIHTFYLLGDAGNLSSDSLYAYKSILKDSLSKASDNSTVLFLGDNIYPKGMPKNSSPERKQAEDKLDNQLELIKDFKGQTIFIPGNHDWYSKGIKGLKREQEYLQDKSKNLTIFAPQNGCAIETRKINKKVALILVDTEWIMADWNKNPGINEKCDIKTREDFYTELEDQLNKNQNRTVILATHHPLSTQGSHGGYFSLESQIYPLDNSIPLPILGSFITLLRTTSGMTHQDNINPQYRAMTDRIKTLIGGRDNVVVVSGHEHTLQFLENNGIKQIVSGATSKTGYAKAVNETDFTYGKNGYVVLDVKQSGAANVKYYSLENNSKSKLLFQTSILEDEKITSTNSYKSQFPQYAHSSVYDKDFTKKSKFYQFLWGKHYRDYYSTDIKAKTLTLDTIYGGLTPTRSGGGHQTKSLRLEAKDGQEYAMRALKKSGVQFLQSVAFKNRYIVDDFEDTFADRFLMDFYTTSHPYMPLVVGKLSDDLGIRNTEPKLFYVPKQNALANFNDDFGDELYYLEIRPSENEDNPNEVLSTEDVLANLIKDEKYKMDEAEWIKVRLFDMLIGDWDRHHDQWKFEEFKQDDEVLYKPIPKDRDQAFTKYDGIVTNYFMTFPALKHMQSFGDELKSVKWFNKEPYPLDLAFTKNATEDDWIKQAKLIQSELTEEKIREAFKALPKEVQEKTTEELIHDLLKRKDDLQKYAKDYYEFLNRKVLLVGTNKKDKFVVTRLPNKETKVKIFRTKKSGEELIFSKTYSKKLTKEIWIYGLSDDDAFVVDGEKKSGHIKVRLFGSLDSDHYDIETGNNVYIYDYETQHNVINQLNGASVRLTDDYEINQYDYKRPKYSVYSNTLTAGYNPDDEVIVGFNNEFTVNNFILNPYSSKHLLKTNYFTGSNGYEVAYEGIFPRLTGDWFYQLDARITSSHYIKNFFGLGNESINPGEKFGEHYNNVRAKELGVFPSINWKRNATSFSAKLGYETLKIADIEGRFVTLPGVVKPEVFDTQHFGNLDLSFIYENYDNKANPKRGMKFDMNAGWKMNLKTTSKQLPYMDFGLGFLHYLTTNQKLVWSTYAKAKWLLSNDYLFYQMAILGGNDDLRGFRFNRFYGKNSFFQTTDLRYEIGNFKNSFTPVSFTIFAGFDLGRVWLPNEVSNQWHNSYGGGLLINMLDTISMKASFFQSSDGGRLMIGIGGTF